ncbi:antibiotic biosynthesis monooxygenase family protein [Nonlabens tegetincola]|uniref:antibiotic biosynthesis monooxygenase family protein n=1 Tax=Nonlabens tegetincola TaxID=323273 RepID=UPI000CF3670D|nr:antibiotic biosynthesis monooxygenase [Nonlabens tegetincola]PQJ20085.1 antibiotic biosynthesis monooxygenase [Nonlabens tegetincola]
MITTPYYAVIFTSILKKDDPEYHSMASLMEQAVTNNDGFIQLESARDDLGITISYWKDLSSIKKWKHNLQHLKAQKLGKTLWYSYYKVRICKVEHEYEFKI